METTTQATMTAVVLDRFGDETELVRRALPVPDVGARDVLIRVGVAGIGSWDAGERQGEFDGYFREATTFPYVLGWDAAGTVVAVGSDVERLTIGDRVYAATTPVPRGGAYAEYVVVDAEHVARVPSGLSTEQAGVMAWDALTALRGVELLGLRPGESVMVFGASGGMGHMAVQLARHHGARVLAVASGADGVALARELGADAAVDGRREDVSAAVSAFAPQGLDAALVTVGGEVVERALRAVQDPGRIAWPNGVYPNPSASLRGAVTHFDGDRSRAALDRLNAIVEAGAFAPHVARTFPLADVQDAHRALREHYVGKLALRIASDDVEVASHDAG